MLFFSQLQDPLIIAGPCSAETREQVLNTAGVLKETGIHLFRAGAWKPRTRPGSFEGHGVQALEWLLEVKSRFHLPVTTEVAEPTHVEQALKAGIDALWIGARTTVSPFQVQQLADALKGVPISVMVKNPVNPDVDLWEGALERIQAAGVSEVAAIHRGFSSYQASTQYKNQPNWIIPIELKRRRPDTLIICDPSHIAGKRSLVAEVSQKALDMGFGGLMIETHPNPDAAWSDPAQQLTPEALRQMLQQLVVRTRFTADMSMSNELEYLRQLMDSVDAEIIDLLARRLELSTRMGVVKKACNMTVYSPERWRDIVETRSERAEKLNMSSSYILSLYEKIHHESIKRQLEILEQPVKD